MANHLLFKVLFIICLLYLFISLICFMGEETVKTCAEQNYAV